MQYLYRCGSCGAHFRADRRQCTHCGRLGVSTVRGECRDCRVSLADAGEQRCPACGDTDVETLSRT